MQDNATFFFLLQHICLYGSPVSHCLLCLVIIIGTAILSTLNYFTLFLKEKLCNRKGILLYLSPPCWSTDALTWCLRYYAAPVLITTILHKQKERQSEVAIHLVITQQTHMKSYQMPGTGTEKMNKKCPSSHRLVGNKTKGVIKG